MGTYTVYKLYLSEVDFKVKRKRISTYQRLENETMACLCIYVNFGPCVPAPPPTPAVFAFSDKVSINSISQEVWSGNLGKGSIVFTLSKLHRHSSLIRLTLVPSKCMNDRLH